MVHSTWYLMAMLCYAMAMKCQGEVKNIPGREIEKKTIVDS